MSINGDYLSMAEACGERDHGSPAFVPGVDFDPSDPDDVEAIREASARHRHDRMAALERENTSLHAQIAELTRVQTEGDKL